MLNNINSSTVGLNQNLGKLQETGSVGNNLTKEPVKPQPNAVWEDRNNENKNMDKWEVGDLVLRYDADGKPTLVEVAGWNELGQPIFQERTKGFQNYLEEHRGDFRKK